MNSALAADGTRRLDNLHGLTPDSSPSTNGAAEARPLQLCWSWWSLVPLTFVAAALAAPYFLTHDFPAISFALYRGFASQPPAAGAFLWIFGTEIAVCSRCLGIYLGAALGLLFSTSRAIAFRLLMAAAALNLFDAMTE